MENESLHHTEIYTTSIKYTEKKSLKDLVNDHFKNHLSLTDQQISNHVISDLINKCCMYSTDINSNNDELKFILGKLGNDHDRLMVSKFLL